MRLEQHQIKMLRLEALHCFSGVASELKLCESDVQVLTIYDRSFSERISNIQSDYFFAWPLGSSNKFQRCGTYTDIADLAALVNAGISEIGIGVDDPGSVFLHCETTSYAVEIPAQVFLKNSGTILEYLWQLSSKDYNSCVYVLPESRQWFFLVGTEKSATFDLAVNP